MSEAFLDWVDSLTHPQVTALAFQSGISGCMTFPLTKLRQACKDSNKAAEIYDMNYVS